MIVCISDNFYFRYGILQLAAELCPDKEIAAFDMNTAKKQSADDLVTEKPVSVIVDYTSSDSPFMFSLLEKKQTNCNLNIIVISDIRLNQDPIENILIDAVADYFMEKRGCMAKLRQCLSLIVCGLLVTRSVVNRHWAEIKKKANLTHREMAIFPYIVSGERNKEISRKINISQKTVSLHRRHIYSKLNVNTLAGLFNILSVAE